MTINNSALSYETGKQQFEGLSFGHLSWSAVAEICLMMDASGTRHSIAVNPRLNFRLRVSLVKSLRECTSTSACEECCFCNYFVVVGTDFARLSAAGVEEKIALQSAAST
jgi:hypothetical protein